MDVTEQKRKKEEHLLMSKPLRLILLQNGSHFLRSLFFIIGFSVGLFLCLQLKAFHMSSTKTQQTLWSTLLFNHSTTVEIKQESQTQLLQHNMTDQELFSKISSLSSLSSSSSSWFWRRHNNDENIVVKVAFMFLTGGGLPLADLWISSLKDMKGFIRYMFILIHLFKNITLKHPSSTQEASQPGSVLGNINNGRRREKTLSQRSTRRIEPKICPLVRFLHPTL
ncbi:hypothetical protein Rs2_32799 [Raphanus sativus]|nr:hypothetical protein Rs2_32799 [Raphanus sativus]